MTSPGGRIVKIVQASQREREVTLLCRRMVQGGELRNLSAAGRIF